MDFLRSFLRRVILHGNQWWHREMSAFFQASNNDDAADDDDYNEDVDGGSGGGDAVWMWGKCETDFWLYITQITVRRCDAGVISKHQELLKTQLLKQTGKSSLWMADCALFRRRRWLSLRRLMKFVCAPSFINTTLKTSYLLTTYSFKAGWCNGEGTRLPVMWPGVQILASTPYVGWSLLLVLSFTLRGFFSGSSGFP